jgi:aspartyl-tRNA(Asn)/glutamyl-tRNA(Gln) amidotransferase subunit B
VSPYRIHGATGDWDVVVGLEAHAQMTSNAKLFSGGSTEFGAEPNAPVSLDAGLAIEQRAGFDAQSEWRW